MLEQAAEHGRAIGFMHGHSLVLALLAEGYLRAQRLDDASGTADESLALARKLGERGWEAWAWRLGAEVAARREPLDLATVEAHFAEARALVTELGMRPLLAHCRLGLGTVYTRAGRPDEGRKEIAAALGEYRAMDMPYWCGEAERALG